MTSVPAAQNLPVKLRAKPYAQREHAPLTGHVAMRLRACAALQDLPPLTKFNY